MELLKVLPGENKISKLKEINKNIPAVRKIVLTNYMEVGEEVMKVKPILQRTQFQRWCELVGISETTANRYHRMASSFAPLKDAAGNVRINAVEFLCTKLGSQGGGELREDAIEFAIGGGDLTLDYARKLASKHLKPNAPSDGGSSEPRRSAEPSSGGGKSEEEVEEEEVEVPEVEGEDTSGRVMARKAEEDEEEDEDEGEEEEASEEVDSEAPMATVSGFGVFTGDSDEGSSEESSPELLQEYREYIWDEWDKLANIVNAFGKDDREATLENRPDIYYSARMKNKDGWMKKSGHMIRSLLDRWFFDHGLEKSGQKIPKVESPSEPRLTEDQFNEWWPTYPKRKGRSTPKKPARAEWLKLPLSLYDEICNGTNNYFREQGQRDNGKFVKDAARFLRDRMFEEFSESTESPKHQLLEVGSDEHRAARPDLYEPGA